MGTEGLYDVVTRDLELSPLDYGDSTDDSILNLRKPPGACCPGYKYSIDLPARLTEKNLFLFRHCSSHNPGTPEAPLHGGIS